ncbi:MAG: aminoacetone oxidase family FAD-binding enzyme, partial [Firmicutes bacterium]|nr:aminoacetone oxidase family FAD-binding enzyme [Bacillota bacterium]
VLARDGRVGGVELSDQSRVSGKYVLIATGGMSYRHTGSTGDGYQMAENLGHSIVKLRPALIPLETRETWVKDLQGLSLEGVRVQGLAGGRIVAEHAGEMIFTRFGVSGPAILNISSSISKHPAFPVVLKIDMKPSLSREQLEHSLPEAFKNNPGKQLKNVLSEMLPQRMTPVILKLSGVDLNKKVSQITRAERERLLQTLKSLQLTVKGTRPVNEAIVTGGGVDTKEINPSTLESKIIKGLYFAGEIIDVDALTGGYNLQVAFSTGYLCGTSIPRDKLLTTHTFKTGN